MSVHMVRVSPSVLITNIQLSHVQGKAGFPGESGISGEPGYSGHRVGNLHHRHRHCQQQQSSPVRLDEQFKSQIQQEPHYCLLKNIWGIKSLPDVDVSTQPV